MIIIIGSNSGIAQKLIRYSFGKEKIIGLYNRKIPQIRKKNIIFKKINLKNNNFKKLVNYVEKQNDKKLVIAVDFDGTLCETDFPKRNLNPDFKIQIYNLLGSRLLEHNNIKQINVEALNKGVYLIRITNENIVHSEFFIKK